MPPQPVPEMAQLACVARRVLRRMCYTLLPLLLTYGTSCRGFVCKTRQFHPKGSAHRVLVLSSSSRLFHPPPLVEGYVVRRFRPVIGVVHTRIVVARARVHDVLVLLVLVLTFAPALVLSWPCSRCVARRAALVAAVRAASGAVLRAALGVALRAALGVALRAALRVALRAAPGAALRAAPGAALRRAAPVAALRAALGVVLRAALGVVLRAALGVVLLPRSVFL